MRVGPYLLTVEPRRTSSPLHGVVTAVVAIVVALVLSSILFLPAEGGPLHAYRVVFAYAFADRYGFLATVHRAIYLLLCTFAFLVPFRAGLWNIGLPSQVYAGGLAAFAVPALLGGPDLTTPPVAPGLLVGLMAVAGVAGGAVLAAVAGLLRARLNVNEILVTMMLNSVFFWLVAYMIKEGGPFMSATGEGEGFSLPSFLYAPLWAGVPVTALLALGAAALLDWLFARTALGYRIRAFGVNPQAARYGGIDPLTLPLLVFIVGGAFGGLAGYHYFAAVPGVYKIPGNYGYYGDLAFYGIICALIARGSGVGAIPVALLFAGLSLGTRLAQGQLHLPFGVDYALLGLLMMTFVASHVLYQYQPVWRPAAEPATPPVSADAAEG